jgi:hypothetical protein
LRFLRLRGRREVQSSEFRVKRKEVRKMEKDRLIKEVEGEINDNNNFKPRKENTMKRSEKRDIKSYIFYLTLTLLTVVMLPQESLATYDNEMQACADGGGQGLMICDDDTCNSGVFNCMYDDNSSDVCLMEDFCTGCDSEGNCGDFGDGWYRKVSVPQTNSPKKLIKIKPLKIKLPSTGQTKFQSTITTPNTPPASQGDFRPVIPSQPPVASPPSGLPETPSASTPEPPKPPEGTVSQEPIKTKPPTVRPVRPTPPPPIVK